MVECAVNMAIDTGFIAINLHMHIGQHADLGPSCKVKQWESSDMVRFDLGPLQGQTRIAKLKSAYNSLFFFFFFLYTIFFIHSFYVS